MVWFRVDDNLALHPKVIEAGNAAMGLWVRAGAWSAANMTDGYIPARVALHLGSRNLCARLVKSGLFEEAVDGFQFHQWDEKNFTKNQLLSSNSQGRDTRSDKPKRHLSTVDSSTETPRAPARAPARVAPARLRAPNPSLKDGLVTNGHQGGRGLDAAPPPCPLGCEQRDGYRENGTVCDHIDRTHTAANGSAKCHEALAKLKKVNTVAEVSWRREA